MPMSSPTTQDRVKEMRLAGLSPRQISLALGITTQAVYKHLKALGLTKTAKEGAA